MNKTTTILIKNSPILDITSASKELKFVKEIHIVAIRNDVKELLYLLEKEYNGEIKINTINFSKKTPKNLILSSMKNQYLVIKNP